MAEAASQRAPYVAKLDKIHFSHNSVRASWRKKNTRWDDGVMQCKNRVKKEINLRRSLVAITRTLILMNVSRGIMFWIKSIIFVKQ